MSIGNDLKFALRQVARRPGFALAIVSTLRRAAHRRRSGCPDRPAGRVMMLIVGQGARLISFGLVLGLVLAFMLGSALRSMLFGVGAADPVVYLSAVSLLVLIAFCASAIPSWRAARVNRVDALRDE